MKKSIKCLSLLAASIAALTGCKKSSSESTLNVYLYKGGYGISWLNSVAELFKNEPSIQEKFGDVTVRIESSNADDSFAPGQIEGLSNKFDIYFGMNLQSLIGKKARIGGKSQELLADLTDVYNATIPGESLKVGDKMYESARLANMIEDSNGNAKYYTLPWNAGYCGIMYNPEMLEEYEIDVPVTTNELIAACQKITTSSSEHYSIIQGCDDPGTCYWSYLYPTWWAQYEGYDQYINFWHGKLSSDAEDYSDINIFKQQGRLSSLRILESLFADYTVDSTEYNNLPANANSKNYMIAQTEFFLGKGAFYACGDWYYGDMESLINEAKEEGRKVYDVQLMKTPVNSDLVTKLESVDSDEELSNAIKAIDSGATSFDGVEENDFNAIVEARQMIYSTGGYHGSVIPGICKKMDLAKAFLTYLASDKANNAYIKSTKGSNLPFKYNVKEKDPSLYQSLNPNSKLVMDAYNNSTHSPVLVPIPNNFRMSREGGVNLLNANSPSKFEIDYRLNNPMTAQKYYQDDIDWWNTDNRWEILRSKLGAR